MTRKERANGELEKHQAIQSLLVEIRVLNRFQGYRMIEERKAIKQALLNDLWCSGINKYNRDIHGNRQ